ncbi:hypothetical protein K1719_004150 [Acacia pycnantha]|nr:hypothetical protein K1719_004150 [Acacia pycnantha]
MKPSSFVMLLASFSLCLQWFLLFTLILIFPPSCKANSSWGNETDHMSLLKFKELISDDPYHILDSWNTSTHFCNWHGIICGRKHRRVTELRLDGQDMRGSITPHIGNLSFLRVIKLGHNKLHGEIPQDLGRLFRLEVLALTNNTLTGKFPVNITSCSKLSFLSFGGNNLIGKIPMQISSLHNLENLYLAKNNFSGKIPISMCNISSLTNLSLVINNLEGYIPEEIGHLRKLKKFHVGGNKLSGKIPSALYNLSSLTDIALMKNQFNGSLPANMFINLPNLQTLFLGINQISGHIPTSIANSTMLEVISLEENRFVGQIPNLKRLHYLSILQFGDNNLGSNSSKDWEFLNSLSNSTKLTRLAMEINNFGGHLPNTIGNLSTQLKQLSLGDNYISGKIPAALGNLVNINFLATEMNYFTGIIPITFGKFQNMQYLKLLGNKLSGEIIHFIGNLTRLIHLDLSDNILEGKVPPSIRNCGDLQFLDLSVNCFSGTIPVQLFTLPSLSILLELSQNSFVGNLPNEVGNLKNIGRLGVSHNHLSGNIPQAVGECQSLEYLFLQGNLFQETIPLSLASLKGLRYLDLSQNNLSGSIPKDLQDIALLEYLNVSFNMLDGEVPSKGVFGNASAISLMGNNKLCGGISKLELPPCPVKSNRENGFSINNLIGSGSFGFVYKGSLESNEVVAVKVINLQMRGANKSFLAECNALRNTRHRNLVKIISCCSSIDYKGNEFKAIIYEYMVNGSLYNWLYPTIQNLDHHPRVLLLDQPSNVLLDGDMVAHLSDFGLARLLSTMEVISNEHSSTIGIKGTIGYVPPEYGMGSEVSIQVIFQAIFCKLIGLSCSMELPHERMSAADVIKELISIKRLFHSG